MIRCGTQQDARSNRRRLSQPNGTAYWKSDYIQSEEGERPAPQAFLIEQDPHTVIRSHFHTEDQFQVVVAGLGTLGRHRIAPFSVHYAGRYTGYGPIETGAQGVHYFSLRPMTTARAWYLPESKSDMLDVPRRNLLGTPIAAAHAPALRARTLAEVETVIAPQPDGVAAWYLRLPPGGAEPTPRHAGDAERFLVVCGGSLRQGGERLTPWAVLFATADERDLVAEAGEEGLEMLVLQFSPASAAR